MSDIPLFNYLDFETISDCNRRCPTCIRNSHPDRPAIQSWFERNYLDADLVYLAIEQALAMGFRGGVCLSHYNEPMMDERLPEIARRVKTYTELTSLHMNSNGDFLTDEMAAEFDGVFDHIIIALYMNDPVKSQRATWMNDLFKKTKVSVITNPTHIPTHFSPNFDIAHLASVAQSLPCHEPDMRVIINHRRQYLLCCDDVIGNFDLGTFPEVSVAEHWNGKHQEIRGKLDVMGGRMEFGYCKTCPRGAAWT